MRIFDKNIKENIKKQKKTFTHTASVVYNSCMAQILTES